MLFKLIFLFLAERLKRVALVVVAFYAVPGTAQLNHPPQIDYLLRVDSADLFRYTVEMQIRNAPHVFTLAMATHHEYDDRFWRYIQDFSVTASDGPASFVRSDSAVWQLHIAGKDATIRYKINLPPRGPYFAHRPFLSPLGGLVGDIHSFMYMPGHTHIKSTVTFQLPAGWQIATGLKSTKMSNVFTSSSAENLMDCPALIGHLHQWNFSARGIPHIIAYLPAAHAVPFDSAMLVQSVEKIVEQAVKIFGRMPYERYFFLLEDGVNGALEHQNSVTIGAPSSMLATNMKELYEELAHEYFHTWNLMCIKPAEYTALNIGPKQKSSGLWFSEGFTMFYADLLLRRAGLAEANSGDSTRMAHLQSLISRYYADTGNRVISPLRVSLASNEPPGMLGDFEASTHLQGELLAAMLDFLIRDASNNKKNLDGVMKLMFDRFGHNKGFYSADVEQAVKDICLCQDKIHLFFEDYVYHGHAIDFDKYLKLAGLKLELAYTPAIDANRRLAPDLRVYVWQPPGDSVYHLAVTNPQSCWAIAGIHTGDILIELNNEVINNRERFYGILNALKVGDTLWVTTKQKDKVIKIPVIMTGYSKPVVNIVSNRGISLRQQELLLRWEFGIACPIKRALNKAA